MPQEDLKGGGEKGGAVTGLAQLPQERIVEQNSTLQIVEQEEWAPLCGNNAPIVISNDVHKDVFLKFYCDIVSSPHDYVNASCKDRDVYIAVSSANKEILDCIKAFEKSVLGGNTHKCYIMVDNIV